MSFEHLKKLAVAERTVRYSLNVPGDTSVLILAPATEANGSYFRAVLHRNNTASRRQTKRLDETLLEEDVDLVRELFPKHVIRGWEGVLDDKDEQVPFSEAKAAEFMALLPRWLVIEIRNFAQDPRNFLDEDVVRGNLSNGSPGN